ncbi:MAG: hypothetical protein HYV36_07470 [Lentisphaerae bacterium]|nr:hypothetical protein [Lentisphaerota bacterium]
MNETFHHRFREILLHTLARYQLICPVYCLMPDHFHMLWLGVGTSSDQNRAAIFLRRFLNAELKRQGFKLQKQAWDQVLREKDRERGAVGKTIRYIAENPFRKELVEKPDSWSFSGSLAPGYPEFDWKDETFSVKLWVIYERMAADAEQERRR